MKKIDKKNLERQVIIGLREYGIGSVLFRHSVGQILGVSVTDMECLGLIYFKGIAKPSQLSKYTGLTSGATTTMLDRLEKAKLIERRPDPQDRRSTFIVPTNNETTKKIAGLFESSRNSQDKLMSSYSEKELKFLSGFFQKSIKLWEEEREKLQKRTANKNPLN